MKYYIIILLLFLSSCKNDYTKNYPNIVIKHNLEHVYDEALWDYYISYFDLYCFSTFPKVFNPKKDWNNLSNLPCLDTLPVRNRILLGSLPMFLDTIIIMGDTIEINMRFSLNKNCKCNIIIPPKKEGLDIRPFVMKGGVAISRQSGKKIYERHLNGFIIHSFNDDLKRSEKLIRKKRKKEFIEFIKTHKQYIHPMLLFEAKKRGFVIN